MTDAIMRLISVDYSRVNSLTFQFCFFFAIDVTKLVIYWSLTSLAPFTIFALPTTAGVLES